MFRPTKGSMDYPYDEFEDHELLDTGNNDSRLDYERSFNSNKASGNIVFGKVPVVKDERSQKRMFDQLEKEERRRGIIVDCTFSYGINAQSEWGDANKEKEKQKELKQKKNAVSGINNAIRERDNITQLQDCNPQLVLKRKEKMKL